MTRPVRRPGTSSVIARFGENSPAENCISEIRFITRARDPGRPPRYIHRFSAYNHPTNARAWSCIRRIAGVLPSSAGPTEPFIRDARAGKRLWSRHRSSSPVSGTSYLGGARWAPAVARLVVGGALAMAVTYGIGQLVGAVGI